MTARCGPCAARHRSGLTGIMECKPGHLILLDDNRRDPNNYQRTTFVCSNYLKDAPTEERIGAADAGTVDRQYPDCLRESYGWIWNLIRSKNGLCDHCGAEKRYLGRLITDKEIPVHAWPRNGATESPLIARVLYGPGRKLTVQYLLEACRHTETEKDWTREILKARLSIHKRRRHPGDHFPLGCKACRHDPVKKLQLLLSLTSNGIGQKVAAHRPQEDRDRWLLEIIAKIAARWRAYPATDDEGLRQAYLGRIRQEYIASDLNITLTALRDRLVECGLRKMFPDLNKRYPALRVFVVEGLDRGDVDRKILLNLKQLAVTTAAQYTSAKMRV